MSSLQVLQNKAAKIILDPLQRMLCAVDWHFTQLVLKLASEFCSPIAWQAREVSWSTIRDEILGGKWEWFGGLSTS